MISRGSSFSNSMFAVESKSLTLTNIILDGEKSSYETNVNGGIINVKEGAELYIKAGAVLQNAKTSESGGAVYAYANSTIIMTGGTINGNESSKDGPGIYLAEGSLMRLSGNPDFGGTDRVTQDDLDNDLVSEKSVDDIKGTDGNFVIKVYENEPTNGGKQYQKSGENYLVRQDIYIDGYSGEDEATNAASLEVNGNITSEAGSIWVWAEESPHYKTMKQFAKYTSGVTNTATTMAVFRNAREDTITGADQAGQYLYGVTKEDDAGSNVFWYGVEGSRIVILRKIGKNSSGSIVDHALSGAKFNIYTSKTSDTPAKDKNGNILSNLESNASGVFYIGELNFGTYYVKEITAPEGYTKPADGYYFIITVNEDGVGYLQEDNTLSKEVTAKTQ
jgi:hypothetical protein